MYFYKKILVLLVIFITTYIIFRLLHKRSSLLNELTSQREGFSLSSVFSTPSSELASLRNDNSLVSSIQNINPKITNMPISQYCIKASYNTALTGNNMSIDMITYVLNRGCRFIDFEVYLIDNAPYVAYSVDPLYAIIETNNNILLDNALSKAVSVAFSTPCPNKSEPLFIQLRIKSNDSAIYTSVAKSVNYALSGFLYPKPVTSDTPLSDIMGKAVLIIDTGTSPNWKQYDKYISSTDSTNVEGSTPTTTPFTGDLESLVSNFDFSAKESFSLYSTKEGIENGSPSIDNIIANTIKKYGVASPPPSPSPTTPSPMPSGTLDANIIQSSLSKYGISAPIVPDVNAIAQNRLEQLGITMPPVKTTPGFNDRLQKYGVTLPTTTPP